MDTTETELDFLPDMLDESKRGKKVIRSKEIKNKQDQRPVLNHELTSRFTIPEELKDSNPSFQFGWVAYQCRGEHLQSQIDEAVERGWWPVKRDEFPSLIKRYFSLERQVNRESEYITRGGQILMKRPMEDHLAEQQYFKELNKGHRQQIEKGLFTGQNEPVRPAPQQPSYIWQN